MPREGRRFSRKAAGNPERITTQEFGDTPTGTYRVLSVHQRPLNSANIRTYGPHPVIAIEGTSGDALLARINNRTGLLIHGGDTRKDGGLRPTFGCIRVRNQTMEDLSRHFTVHGKPAMVIIGESEKE